MIKEIITNLNAFEIYSLFKDEENSFILDSGMDEKKLGRYSFISSRPFEVIKCKNTEENPLEILREKLNTYKVENNTELPFIGGAVGYISYDLGNYMEKLPRTAIDDTNIFDLYFGLYDFVIVIDHQEDKKYIATPDINIEKESVLIKEIEYKIKHYKNNDDNNIEICNEEQVLLKSNFEKKEYLESIRKIKII